MLQLFYRYSCTVDYSIFQKLNYSLVKADFFLVLAYVLKGQYAE